MLLVAAARSRQRDTSAEFASGEAALSSVHGY
jgi:hypothetical protein